MSTDADELTRMLRDLQEKSAIGEETASDIETYIEDAHENRLDAADLAYVRALHGRLTGRSGPGGDDDVPDDDEYDDDGVDWQARAEEAERLLEEAGVEGPDRFDEIRRRVEARFGPATDTESDDPAAAARADMYRELIAEFDAVENSETVTETSAEDD